MTRTPILLFCCGWLAACALTDPPAATDAPVADELFPSTYEPLPATLAYIHDAVILTGDGMRLDDAAILLRDGRIEALGTDVRAPTDARIIDRAGCPPV